MSGRPAGPGAAGADAVVPALARGEVAACAACLRRTRLIELLSPHIERARHDGTHLPALLALPDSLLLDAVGGARRERFEAELRGFEPRHGVARCAAAGVAAVCKHDARYPARLLHAADAPAILHVAGDPASLVALGAPDEERPAVALVGARRATAYGREVAEGLGRGLGAAGVTVVSGMAMGVDSAGHEGALASGGTTIAVLAGAPDVAYPASKGHLHRRIVARHCAVSELPPGAVARRWSFPARNRVIAALAGFTVVVEASERSGSLITADIALQLGRGVGAVPGPVTSPASQGTNALLRDGAHVVRSAQDVLDVALADGWRAGCGGERGEEATELGMGCLRPDGCEGCDDDGLGDPPELEPEPGLPADLARVLALVGEGVATPGAIAARTGDVVAVTVALTRLELLGRLRREPDGAYVKRLV